jgi:hypothetical protein
MDKKYVIIDFEAQTYYCGEAYGWSKEAYLVDYFETVEDAVNFIKKYSGKFKIEVVYLV